MVVIVSGSDAARHSQLLDSMFEDRKRLFVDLLKWDIPVVDGRLEKDAFDTNAAAYLIALDDDGNHAGSMRLLPTTRPHILGELFPFLCEGLLPRGPSTLEITRLCLPTRHGAARRLTIRNRLISAMVDHALVQGIRTLTGVVEASFLVKVLDMGWHCAALGELHRGGRGLIGAFRIDLDRETPGRLARNWIYTPGTICPALPEQAAA